MSELNGVTGGICKTCNQRYAQGGPHLVALHCLNASLLVIKAQGEALGRLRGLMKGFVQSNRVLWILAQRAGGSFRITNAEIDAVPNNASMETTPDDGALVFTSGVLEQVKPAAEVKP